MSNTDRWHPNMPIATRAALKRMIDEGYSIEVGDYSYGAPAVRWAPDQRKSYSLTIGRYCSFAADIDLYVGRQGRHTIDFLSTYPIGLVHGPLTPGDVSKSHSGNLSVWIGSDVWIGRGAQIMAGVTIGDGAVIGARSLVNADVPPYGVAVGTPARVASYRFGQAEIESLVKIKWWDFPPRGIEGKYWAI